jgi:hypothetical protein
VSEARERVAELTTLLGDALGPNLLALYLFGSLPAGGFVEGRSDVDLLAIVERDVDEALLEELRRLHSDFVRAHPAWEERVEVGYVGRAVLQTFGTRPAGTMAAISPGEPLHLKDATWGWVLNWHGACSRGETLLGPPPLELGPAVTAEAFRIAVWELLEEWRGDVREPTIAWVPAQRGYAVVTVCRALHALETGEQTTKEAAAAWAAERFPEWAEFVRASLADLRADHRGRQARAIRFVDFALERAAETR